jgi:hypothetical protein
MNPHIKEVFIDVHKWVRWVRGVRTLGIATVRLLTAFFSRYILAAVPT